CLDLRELVAPAEHVEKLCGLTGGAPEGPPFVHENRPRHDRQEEQRRENDLVDERGAGNAGEDPDTRRSADPRPPLVLHEQGKEQASKRVQTDRRDIAIAPLGWRGRWTGSPLRMRKTVSRWEMAVKPM